MSTIIRWRITLISSLLLLVGGFVLLVLLAVGLADAPRMGTLQWQTDSPAGWSETQTGSSEWTSLQAPVELPDAFTLELTATNQGTPDSAWGFRIPNADSDYTILIDNQGYFSVSLDAGQPYWTAFIHIRPAATNKLYLHVEPNHRATLRINDEIAWEGEIQAESWSVILFQRPQLFWAGIALYHQN